MKKLLKSVFCVGGWGIAFLFIYMFLKADLSLQTPRPEDLTQKDPRVPVYLISYADGHEVFYKNQQALVYSAINKGFDVFINYRKAILDKNFVNNYRDILSVKSGAGLWLWKPQILLQTMDNSPENSIIVYTDVGFVYVRDAKECIAQLGDYDVALMNVDAYATKEKLVDWMPKKISKEWGVLEMAEDKRPKFIESGLIIVRNTARARHFIQKWLQICARRDYAFISYDKTEDGIKGFTYDQSLLSLIAFAHPDGVVIHPKEQFKRFTVFHHRHPGNNKPLLPFLVLPLKELREKLGQMFPNLFLYVGF